MLLLLVAVLIKAPAPSLQAAPAVTVARVVFGQSWERRLTVEFDVVNNTNAPITAWRVAFVVGQPDGTAERTAIAKDGYLAYSGLVPDPDAYIPPHGSVHGTHILDTPDPTPGATAQAVATCAIFADRSWVGEEKEIRHLFDRRQAEYRGLTEVITELRKARLSARGDESLRVALAGLSVAGSETDSSADKQMMRRNLQTAINKDPSLKGTPDQLMAQWLLQMEARWQASDEHRNQGPMATFSK